MPRLPLGGAYQATSVIAGAQRSVNLYSEPNLGQGKPTDATLYPRAGLTPKGAPPQVGRGRCLYCATNGDLYAIVDQVVYYIDPNFNFNAIGTLTSGRTNPAYIADNGTVAMIVDGSAAGAQINLAARTMSAITDPNFLGADRIAFLNYFLGFNEPGTPNWYTTMASSSVFNALFFGSLTQWPGNCTALIATEGAMWLFNIQKGEVWQDAGTSPFAFQPIPGTIIEHGLIGSYALARYDVNIYWMSRSPEGGIIAMRGINNSAQRISTHAIEQEWLSYSTVTDCIVTTMQERGHAFVYYDFPTADRTWVFDEATKEWHEEAYFDTNGVQHRTLDTFKAFAYGLNLSLGWSTGQLYQRDTTNFSDNGVSCVYLRDFPHLVDADDDRLTIWRVIADIECGGGTGISVPGGNPWSNGFSPGFGPLTLTEPPFITLMISRDRGYSYFSHSDQLMAGPYGYNTKPTFNRCGVAYDAVFRLQWTGPFKTAINGVFIVVEQHEGDM